MDIRVRIAILTFASLIVLVSQISLSFAPSSDAATVLSSGTIVYSTYIVTTLAELSNAMAKVVPGDIVLIRGGIYRLASSDIDFKISGTSGSPITYEAYPNETVVFDGSLATNLALRGYGSWEPPLIVVNANWNILRNIEVRNNPVGEGIRVYGSDDVLDHVDTHDNAGSGAETFGLRTNFLYCVSHDNVDANDSSSVLFPGGDADGLGADSPSAGNYFLRCVVYNNSDDGIDCLETTNNMVVECVCYANGGLSGDGFGFKPGANDRINKCVAYNNNENGFGVCAVYGWSSDNVIIDHCTAYNNGVATATKAATGCDDFASTATGVVLTNNIASTVWYSPVPTHNNNTWDLGITNYVFLSTDPTSANFLSLSATSACRGKASDGSDLGALQYGETINSLLGI